MSAELEYIKRMPAWRSRDNSLRCRAERIRAIVKSEDGDEVELRIGNHMMPIFVTAAWFVVAMPRVSDYFATWEDVDQPYADAVRCEDFEAEMRRIPTG